MTHDQIKDCCLSLGLEVKPEPADGKRLFSATGVHVRVYWFTSYEGSLLGLPRVISAGHDTHARSLKDIRYLVKLSR